MTLTPVPEDFHTITPQLVVKGVADGDRLVHAGARRARTAAQCAPDGTSIMHAELLLGDSRFFVVDEFPDSMVSPATLGGTTVTLHLYVRDVDALFDRAVEAGATVVMPVADQFWGDRYGILRDPFGHRWSIASRIEDLSPGSCRSGPRPGPRIRRRYELRTRRGDRVRRVSPLERVSPSLIHGFILAADYEPYRGTLLRDFQGGPGWQVLLLPVAHLCFISGLVWVYARLSLDGSLTARGLKLGLIAWLVGQAPLWLLWYAEQPWPG